MRLTFGTVNLGLVRIDYEDQDQGDRPKANQEPEGRVGVAVGALDDRSRDEGATVHEFSPLTVFRWTERGTHMKPEVLLTILNMA